MDTEAKIVERQLFICRKYGAEFVPAPSSSKIGISRELLQGLMPFNGLRHSPDAGTNGWYLWGGTKWSDASDFFLPMHLEHLYSQDLKFLDFLGLAPGWRFLLADDWEDVWFDPVLLE